MDLIKVEEHIDPLSPKGVLGRREYLAVPEQAVFFTEAQRLICQSVGYWSYRDIFDIFDGQLSQALKIAGQQFREHALQCKKCAGVQEDLCACGKFVGLFDEGVFACPKCGILQHLICAKKAQCPGCKF